MRLFEFYVGFIVGFVSLFISYEMVFVGFDGIVSFLYYVYF